MSFADLANSLDRFSDYGCGFSFGYFANFEGRRTIRAVLGRRSAHFVSHDAVFSPG